MGQKYFYGFRYLNLWDQKYFYDFNYNSDKYLVLSYTNKYIIFNLKKYYFQNLHISINII